MLPAWNPVVVEHQNIRVWRQQEKDECDFPHVPSSENSNPSTSGLQQTDTQDKDSMRKNDDDTTAKEKEKEGCISDWLSGGPMGSKGVVLVFRSCVLASRTPSMESTTKTVGNNTGTTILLNKAKNMARRLVAEPHSFSVRPANIMHDVMETFGNTTKYTGQAYVVRHVSDAEVPETAAIEEQGHEPVEHKRDIEDVLNDLSKITLKKHLNIENTTANIKPPEEPPPPECSKDEKKGKKTKGKNKKKTNSLRNSSPPLDSDDSEHLLIKEVDSVKAYSDKVLRSYELTRKDKLFKNIEKMQYFRGLKHFDFIPTTFLMPAEFKELCTTHYRTKGPWIVKPAASSRGRGIYIVNTPEQIPKGENVVVAKYIDKPLLIGGHKCDLRLYVCVTSIDPLLIYLYEEGLVRFATVKYDKTNKNLWNPCMHLCNYSINKYHTDYIKCDDPNAGNIGHKWTLSALLRHLRKQAATPRRFMTAIEDLVVKSVLSSAQTITAAARVFVPNFFNCFGNKTQTVERWLRKVNECAAIYDWDEKQIVHYSLQKLTGLAKVCATSTVPEKKTQKIVTNDDSSTKFFKNEAGLTLNLPKCDFFSTRIEYLGYEVSAEGIKPSERKITAVKDFPTPSSIHERVISDRGTAFTSSQFKDFCVKQGFDKKRSYDSVVSADRMRPWIHFKALEIADEVSDSDDSEDSEDTLIPEK
ncbi:LOW QUALITY PROTEIN: uncharacterized protein [Choristoneura fumiferana]|uniref:LOW QUALITY PROTEIN: uncharacterized protein n=1 Tax=Choristoneura fumiferana TaxID=7141 RepID=UPI003D154BF5